MMLPYFHKGFGGVKNIGTQQPDWRGGYCAAFTADNGTTRPAEPFGCGVMTGLGQPRFSVPLTRWNNLRHLAVASPALAAATCGSAPRSIAGAEITEYINAARQQDPRPGFPAGWREVSQRSDRYENSVGRLPKKAAAPAERYWHWNQWRYRKPASICLLLRTFLTGKR